MYPGMEKAPLEVPFELIQYIKTGTKFIIAGHKEPDGDCIGSQLALRSALVRLGKKAVVCSEGPITRKELNGYNSQFTAVLTEEDKTDAKVIIVDCIGVGRTGSLQEMLEKFPCAIIDHHEAVIHKASTVQAPVFADPDSPSCTLLIEKVITALDLELTEEEAALLFFGLCTDTGYFRHLTENDAYVFEVAAKMIRCGASPKKTFQKIYGHKSTESRILIGNILSRIESYFGGKLLISYETLEDLNTFGFENRDSDILNQLLQSIDGVEAIAVIRQECCDSCTVSLRSIDKIDVAQIAVSFGGGGHKNASGLTMQGTIPNIRQIMLESFSKFFV